MRNTVIAASHHHPAIREHMDSLWTGDVDVHKIRNINLSQLSTLPLLCFSITSVLSLFAIYISSRHLPLGRRPCAYLGFFTLSERTVFGAYVRSEFCLLYSAGTTLHCTKYLAIKCEVFCVPLKVQHIP